MDNIDCKLLLFRITTVGLRKQVYLLRLSTRANARVTQVSTYGTKLKEVLTLGIVPVPRRHSPSESCRCFLRCLNFHPSPGPDDCASFVRVFEHFPPILF